MERNLKSKEFLLQDLHLARGIAPSLGHTKDTLHLVQPFNEWLQDLEQQLTTSYPGALEALA